MMDEVEIDNNMDKGKILESYLNLIAVKNAYVKNKEEGVADKLQVVIDLLCKLSAENEELKKKLVDMSQRLKSCEWIFCGVQ